MTWFANSILLAAATVLISLAVSVPAAYCFSRRRFPGRRLVLRWLVLLNSFPAILSMFAVYRLLQPLGLVNHRLGLIIVYTGTMAVFSLWNMKGYFDTIPVDIEEAARMDGATDLQVVTRIVMPLAKPSVVVTALMVLIYVWNEYIYATTFMTGEENYTLGCRAVRPSGHGDERELAGLCRREHRRLAAGADNFLPLPEAHDFRPHGGRR